MNVINHLKKDSIFDKPIKYLKGLSTKKADLFNSILHIYTYEDFLCFYPKKYIFFIKKNISEISIKNDFYIQVTGIITDIKEINGKTKKILIARLEDRTGFIELLWFRKIHLFKNFKKNRPLIVLGKIFFFQKKIQIIHPKVYDINSFKRRLFLYPIYHIPQSLKKKGINNSFIIKLLDNLIKELELYKNYFFFQKILKKKIMSKKESLIQIHFPKSSNCLLKAKYLLKFEKLLLLKLKSLSKRTFFRSKPFYKIGKKFFMFYKKFLPFNLTNDQKKAFKEIWIDLKKPIQMHRLLQGDVGSGKTIVAILTILVALENGYQSCIMTPTEVLAIQHYQYIKKIFQKIGINQIELLTGNISNSIRNKIYHQLLTGKISIIIGTHSLIQKNIKFQKLGLVIIDEQQRFGVKQINTICNSYNNQNQYYPHVLIMTATPIPRTLARTIYCTLNISIIKEKPIKKKPIKTIHLHNEEKNKAFEIIENEIVKGRQVYIVYPTISQSFHKKYENLMIGYNKIKTKFQNLKNQIGILHGRMNTEEKKIQIHQFICGITKIMTTTTIIEVGLDIPNATVIMIENANFFGLSQLHQLRGRVGRGLHQSYCLLITNNKISIDGIGRMNRLCKINNGFEISKEDLKIRGIGDLTGIKQSGKKYFPMVNFTNDIKLIKKVNSIAKIFLIKNPHFMKKNRSFIQNVMKYIIN
ncbi:ATP-dependent DNA helicase RecG [Blattabacterium cuenoti]|uniref:ATP-dependent DNA helicase RecG n=1 Tax=Blattabacterium cuenoti TaxID=1653831 RepID=UPI001EEA75C7|nr:DEAD/DEAH box helicase [Blattabacterium cuenoti]